MPPVPQPPDQLEPSPDDLQRLYRGGLVSASAIPAPQESAPDTLPPSSDDLHRLMVQDPWFQITPEHAKILKADLDSQSIGTKAGKLWEGVKTGVGGVVDQVEKAHEELKNAPYETYEDRKRLYSTLGEGALEGLNGYKNLATQAMHYLWDKGKEAVTGATEDEKVQNFYNRLVADQQRNRRASGLPDYRPLDYDPEHPPFVPLLSPSVYGTFPPYPEASKALSFVLPPVPPVLAGAGKVTSAVAKGAAKTALQTALKVPGVLPVAEKVSEGLSKAAPVIERADQVVRGILPLSKAPQALETAGTVAKTVGGLPEKIIEAAVDKALPEGARAMGEKLTHLVGGGAALAGATGHGGPLGPLLAVLKGLEGFGVTAEKAGQFGKEFAATEANSQIPRLLQIANKPGVPEWIQGLAKGLHQSGIGAAAQFTKDIGESAVHGAATGAALGAISTEDPEKIGEFAGMGAPLGVAGRLAVKASGAEGRQRAIEQRMGDLGRFFVHLKEQGVPDETILKIQTAPALMASALQAATARGIFHNGINFKFLEGKDYEPLAKQSGFAGTAAFHDPTSNSIVVNVDAKRDALTHELGHAALKATGADSEARLLIDSIFTPEQVNVMGREYAQRLVDNRIKSENMDPSTVSPEDYKLAIDNTVQQLNDAHKGDRWIYDEIYADAAYGGLLGQDIKKAAIDSSSLRQLAQSKILEALGASPEPGEKGVPPRGLFTEPEVYNNRQLRQLTYQHLRDLYKNGASAGVPKETKEGVPQGVQVPKDLIGKHPSVPVFPNPATGRLENDFAVVDPAGKVTLRSPGEVRQIERERQREVKTQTAALEKQPAQPNPGPSGTLLPTDLAPRKNAAGVVEIVGTKIKGFLDKLTRFGDEAKKNGALAEGAIDTGNVLDTWYQSAGTGSRGSSWASDVRKRLANVAASKVKLAPFLFKISKEGNVLVVGLSLNAADRKLARWADKENSLLHTLWGGDRDAFKADLMTYLKNHADGRPGADVIGDKKRDALNTFVIGDHRTFSAANPLRDTLHGQEKQGIIRSLRLDRMMNAETAADKGWYPEYEKKVHNLSPEVSQGSDEIVFRKGWLDPDGKFHELGDFPTHNQFAQRLLGKNVPRSSSSEPAKDELIKRGWVRFTPSGTVHAMVQGKPNRAQLRAIRDWANTSQGLESVVQVQDDSFAGPKRIWTSADKNFSPDVDNGGINKAGENNKEATDPVTGLPTIYKDGPVAYDQARDRIRTQAKAATARDLVVALLEKAAKEADVPFDRDAAWRNIAKSSRSAQEYEWGAREAVKLLTLTPEQFEQKKASKVLALPIQEAAEKARAAIPVLPDSTNLSAVVHDFMFGPWKSGDRFGDFSVVGKGAEGPVLEDPNHPGFVYKIFSNGLHLDDVFKTKGNFHFVGVNHDTLFDTISKIDRLAKLPGGLPIEIQGITSSGFLVTKMPKLERVANEAEVKQWVQKYGHQEAVSALSPNSSSSINPFVGHDQPIMKDEHGNSYASADIRPGRGDTYPNLMVDKDGNVWATDVMTRPIDQADVERSPKLSQYAPKAPDKILYSPDTGEVPNEEEDSVARHRGVELTEAAKERVGTTGQYVGAPEGVTAPRHVQAILDRIEKSAHEGEVGRFWYEDSSKAILDITGGDKKDAEMLAALVAVTSPNNKVYPNMSMAVKAYYQAKAGLPITAGKTGQMTRAAQRVVDGERWEGVKTNNFYINLMRKIDPTLSQGVTVDMWIMRLLGYKKDSPSPTQYTFAARQIERVAKKIGWEPQQVQAALWVAGRARWEAVWPEVKALAIKNGDLAPKGNDYGKAKWVSKEKQKYYNNLALRKAFKLEEGSFDITNFNFAHALARDLGQISWESRPGTTTGEMPGMANATYPQLAEYHAAISRVLTDEHGRDIIAKEVGLLSPGAFDVPGVWKDQNNPSTQVPVVAPRAGVDKVGEGKGKKGERKTEIDPTVRQTITDYCAMLGLLLKQDAVGWHRPFYTDLDQAKVGQANMVELDFHRPLTLEETRRFQKELISTMGGEENFALIGWRKGIRLMNFSGLDNPSWHGKIKETVNRFTDRPVNFKRIASDGDLIDNNWKEQKDGENYRSRIREARRSDLLGRVYDLLHEKIDRVNADFARKYGWDKASSGAEPGESGREAAPQSPQEPGQVGGPAAGLSPPR